jgi:hypothetical protein
VTPVKQRNKHRPKEGVWGDCHRACIASLLDLPLDDVPHFGDGGPAGEEFNDRVNHFLRSRNLAQGSAAFAGSLESVLEMMKFINPGIYYILGGRSRTNVDHSVIAFENQIVHDPSLNNSGIIAPCDDGFIWVTFIVAGVTVK